MAKTIEYLPHDNRPDTYFEFMNTEIEAYFEDEIRALEKAVCSAQHRQIARDYQKSIKCMKTWEMQLKADVEQSDGKLMHVNFSRNSSNGDLIARVLEAGFGNVICSECQNIYGAKELLFYDWSHGEFAGRLVTCVNDHTLLKTNERLGEFSEIYPPFQRTLRDKVTSELKQKCVESKQQRKQ